MSLQIALKSTLSPLLTGFVMILLPAAAGYPGVVCITPMLWLLALQVGRYCARHSAAPVPDSAAGGALLGFFYGIFSSFLSIYAFDYAPNESMNMIIFAALLTCGGVVACSLIAMSMSVLKRRRSNLDSQSD